MAKQKQAKNDIDVQRKRRPRGADGLVSNSGNGIGIPRDASTDARDIARCLGRFAHRCVDLPQSNSRVKSSIVASSTVAQTIMPQKDGVTEIADSWARAMNEIVSQKMPDIISDYIIDLVQTLRGHFSSEYSKKELSQISRFLLSETGERLVSDEKLAEHLCEARDTFQKKIVSTLQSPECFEMFKKNMRTMDV